MGDFGPARWEPAAHPAALIKSDPSPLIKPDPSPVPSPRAAAPRKRARRGASQPLFLPDDEFLGDWEQSVVPPSAKPGPTAASLWPAQVFEQGPSAGGGASAAAEEGSYRLWGSQPAAQPTALPESPRLRPSLLELALAGEPMASNPDVGPTPAPWDLPVSAPAAHDAPAPAESSGAAAGSGVVPLVAGHDALASSNSPEAAAGSGVAPAVRGLDIAGVAAAPAGHGVAPGMAKLQAAIAARLQARRDAMKKGSQI